jgi:hypothetical protein
LGPTNKAGAAKSGSIKSRGVKAAQRARSATKGGRRPSRGS